MDNSEQNIETRLANLEQRVAELETLGISGKGTVTTILPQKQISVKEFLLAKKVSSAMEKTLALAYYLEHIEHIASFNINDIVNAFQAARERVPANPNDMVNKNIAKALLMEASEMKDGKKAWVLTATGEKFVENDFNE